MEIKGHGLAGNKKTVVTVDGVECEITHSTNELIRCITGEATQPSKLGY